MTTEKPAGAAADPAAGTRQAPAGDAAAARPDDPQALSQEIERTREQLGQTVAALAAKADVKVRAREKAGQVAGRLKTTAARRRQQAAARTGELQRQLAGTTAGPRQKAASMGEAATGQVRQQAAAAAQKLSALTPQPARHATAKAAAAVRQRRVLVMMAAGAVVLAWLAVGRGRQR
jgi:Protein of unknown function (DUF3618)